MLSDERLHMIQMGEKRVLMLHLEFEEFLAKKDLRIDYLIAEESFKLLP